MSDYRTAAVYISGQPAGLLEETDAGYRFTDDAAWLQQENPQHVSLTLPVRKEPYACCGCCRSWPPAAMKHSSRKP